LPAKIQGVTTSVFKRAKRIQLILMDVDGTLTDGRVCLVTNDGTGGVGEMKVFNAHDGAGLKLAHIMGLKTGLITGRDSPVTAQRAKEMSMDFVFQGRAQKEAAYKECLERSGLRDDSTAYIGDDLPDLPLLKRAGLAVATANAVAEVKKAAHYVTRARGGEGAAREVVELILKAQGKWQEAIPKSLA